MGFTTGAWITGGVMIAAGAIGLGLVADAGQGETGARAAAPGAPQVVQFKAPRSFWCLPAHPGQAQLSVGWSVPSATKVVVLLDGQRVHSGIRNALPFSVMAGTASGIGTTVVFPCRSGRRHRLTIRWRSRKSTPSTRSVTIHKAIRR